MALALYGKYKFGRIWVELLCDPGDKTAATDSLVIKVKGTEQPIMEKLGCGHHFCVVITPLGRLDLSSCLGSSPRTPTWKTTGSNKPVKASRIIKSEQQPQRRRSWRRR